MTDTNGTTRAARAIEEIQTRHRHRFNASPAHVALLDATGAVKLVNPAWTAFSDSNGGRADAYLGENYLEVCRKSAASNDHAALAFSGLKAVLDGDLDEFVLNYPCHSPSAQRWYRMEVTLIDLQQRSSVIVSHLNVTQTSLEQIALRNMVETVQDALAVLGFNAGAPTKAPPEEKPFQQQRGDTVAEVLGDTVIEAHYLAAQMLEFVKRAEFTEKESTELLANLINQWAQSLGARLFNGENFFPGAPRAH
ncbi:hypothetical protein M2323_000601 [Rhodoblastus acidophilus]|uniref:hypothetical protein n=1 Tax=Rhodoblastus acidophilus TaxID=1074 RepID=UPI0022242555|nr:hypothetical protein [Rhodoblastus acidophilus]MCW2282836.1 hypothetical protein [Rhodoblastus acidophilus]MCW2331697.1 hypothetical protein [Rhodoblastus acidophilus]